MAHGSEIVLTCSSKDTMTGATACLGLQSPTVIVQDPSEFYKSYTDKWICDGEEDPF